MTGLRVLDVGARDGFYSFECERRGAEVVAIDYADARDTGFLVAKEILGSALNLIQDNVFNITHEKYGTFDIVLFLGVLYHLRDPLMAIDALRNVCRGELFLETHVIDESFLLPDGRVTPLAAVDRALLDIPIMQFYSRDVLNHDATNYWGPNMRCVELMLEEANFTLLSRLLNGQRAIFRCKINSDTRMEYLARIGRGTI